ncbi:MAG: NAD-binding protein [Leptolyngbyaceae cyanobacterium bins.349]|nr:NAD-binding protein [Leptolyngbyaceae cyanobacterium bins.349]
MVRSGLSDLQNLQAILQLDLETQGITVKLAQEAPWLYMLLEAEQVPERSPLLGMIQQHIARLPPASFPTVQTVRIYGRQIGDSFAAWSREIVFPGLGPQASPHQREVNPAPSQVPPLTPAPLTRVDHFIVCGLGRLGQHCVMSLQSFALANFEVKVTAIDRQQPGNWEVDHLSDLLAEEMITGDCRQDSVLKQAGIQDCRAILIVTQDENVNIETAIAARRLNPTVRLIVRSGKQNLNELLKQRLGNFAAFEPIELPARSFALAALGAETLGLFKVGDRPLRVIEHQVQVGDLRFENLPIHKLYKDTCRLLRYIPAAPAMPAPTRIEPPQGTDPVPQSPPFKGRATTTDPLEHIFYHWHPETQIRPGDTLVYIEAIQPHATSQPAADSRPWFKRWQWVQHLVQRDGRSLWSRLWDWIHIERTRQITSLGFAIAFLLGALGTVLLKFTIVDMTWQAAISSAVILLLGGYGDVFGGLESALPIPWWVQIVCLLITATSILFVLSVLGLLADRLLSTRFEFLQQRPPVPQADHVVLVGLGRVGQHIASLLQEFRQPFVGLTHVQQPDLMPQVPVVCSPILQGLESVNLAQAKSLIVATDDQMLNLEVALMARNAASQINRTLNLVIRAQDQRFCDHLTGLMPDARSLCVYALTAEAFAGAAFGENILNLFQLAHQTILVTEYHIDATDTLEGKLLAQIAYGYGVAPIAYQACTETHFKVLPSDNVRLQAGDRLVVLATINGLQRIEWGTLSPPRRWQLQALKPLDPKVTFYAGNTLENISGCPLSEARAFMDHLPQTLDVPGVMELDLYDQQADHLLRKLRKLLPIRLIPMADFNE